MKRCGLLLLTLTSMLDGCASDRWQTQQPAPGRYELVHSGGIEPGALRPEFGRRAEKLCRHGYQMTDPQVMGQGWHGNAVLGEGPTWTVRAEVRCNDRPSPATGQQAIAVPVLESSKPNADMSQTR